MICIIEIKRLNKIKNVRIYNTKYKNKSKTKSKIQNITKRLSDYIK